MPNHSNAADGCKSLAMSLRLSAAADLSRYASRVRGIYLNQIPIHRPLSLLSDSKLPVSLYYIPQTGSQISLVRKVERLALGRK